MCVDSLLLLPPSVSNRTLSTDCRDNYNTSSRVYYKPCHYGNRVLYGASAIHLHSLQSLLKQKFDSIRISIRDELHWLPINQRIEYKLSAFVFKCLHRTAPPYLTEQCVLDSANADRRRLRSSTRNCLMCPRVNLSRHSACGFYISGPKTWNQLPDNTRNNTLTE